MIFESETLDFETVLRKKLLGFWNHELSEYEEYGEVENGLTDEEGDTISTKELIARFSKKCNYKI